MSAGRCLKDISKPIGVSEYKVTSNLTGKLEKQLPSVEDIQNRIKWDFLKFVKSIFTVCSYRVYLHFDHHLTTTVQAAPQNVGKARCDNQQRAFSCFGGKCAEPTKFTFHRQSIPPCRSSPTRKARGSTPFGRTKKRIAMYFCNALFCSDFRIILVAYHLPRPCTDLLPAVRFSANLWWFA